MKTITTILDTFISNITITSILITVASLLLYQWISTSSNSKNLPPCLPRVPVLGSIPFLGVKVEESFSEYANKYGPIFYAQLGSYWAVILNNYESIYEVCSVCKEQ